MYMSSPDLFTYCCVYYIVTLRLKYFECHVNFNRNTQFWNIFRSMSNPVSVNRKAKLQIRLLCPQRKDGSTIPCKAVYNIFTQKISLSNLFMCLKKMGKENLALNMNRTRVFCKNTFII